MSFFRDEYGLKTGWFATFLCIGLVTAATLIAWIIVKAIEPKCTPELEGVLRYPGQYGGFVTVCRDGEWRLFRGDKP